jgi:enterochelin esterase-like enzyme
LTFSLPQPWPTNPWETRFRTVRASPPDELAAGSRVLTVQSPALRGRGELIVHVTDGIDLPQGTPIVVLLHGVYGSCWNWMLNGRAHHTLDRLVRSDDIRPMVLAMPSDGMRGEGTAYLSGTDADVERWIIDDVVDCVGELVDGANSESPLFLGGNSMGAFGAARIGLRYRTRVAGIAMHSAITHLDQLAQFTVDDIGTAVGLAPTERDLLDAFERCTPAPPLYIDCGRDDPLADANRVLHQQLVRRRIEHEYAEFDGGHDWDAWTARIEHGLRFFELTLTGAR